MAAAASPAGLGVLSDGNVSVPAIDLHDRYVVAAFDVAPSPDANWTVTDDAGVSRPAHLLGYVGAVRLAVLSVETVDSDTPTDGASQLPAAAWSEQPSWVGATITIGGHDGELVSMGDEPTADGLALEHALVADTDGDPNQAVEEPGIGDVVWSDGMIVGLVVHRNDRQVLVIPSNLVKAAAASVINGTPELAWLGVAVTGTDHAGISISAVNPTSPAAAIGLRVGDIVESVNATAIASPADLVAEVWRCGPGREVQIVVKRGDTTLTLAGHLAAIPANA